MDNTFKFNQPWILQRADPFVLYENGWYYFTASVPAYDSIVLRRSLGAGGIICMSEKPFPLDAVNSLIPVNLL